MESLSKIIQRVYILPDCGRTKLILENSSQKACNKDDQQQSVLYIKHVFRLLAVNFSNSSEILANLLVLYCVLLLEFLEFYRMQLSATYFLITYFYRLGYAP